MFQYLFIIPTNINNIVRRLIGKQQNIFKAYFDIFKIDLYHVYVINIVINFNFFLAKIYLFIEFVIELVMY